MARERLAVPLERTVPVTKWLVRQRGRAMAYTSLGVPLTQILIDEVGWRAAWALLALIGAGPPLAGYIRDVVGSYDQVWYVAVGLMVAGAVMVATTPPGRPAGATS